MTRYLAVLIGSFLFAVVASAGGAFTVPCTVKNNREISITYEGNRYKVSSFALTISLAHDMSAMMENASDSSDKFRGSTNPGDCVRTDRLTDAKGLGKCELDEETEVVYEFDTDLRTCQITNVRRPN